MTALPHAAQGMRELAAFLPVIEADDFEFVRGVYRIEGAGGVPLPWPNIEYHPVARRIVRVVDRLSWLQPGWPDLLRTEDGQALQHDPDRIARATPLEIAILLTRFARAERFVTGDMAHFHDSGLLIRVLRRAAVLATELQPQEP
jgi:hypothetical protein